MLRSMTTRQFQEWRAYADLEPFDEERADLRAASIVQALLNLMGRRKGQPAFSLKDCVVRFGVKVPQSRAQAQEEVRRTMEILMLVHNQPPQGKKAKR